MTPGQLAEALRVRRRREERALAEVHKAQAMHAQALAGHAQAVDALVQFDARLDATIRSFEARARIGINPHSITNMRAFHADQLQARGAYHEPIAVAEGAVALAEDAVEQARILWRQASQAAENLQDLGKSMARDAARDVERRQEQDRDEIAATRSMRMMREGED